jgi:nitroreductase/NAD-dependent dihydropyrimidine dehydrogenase PreA subunit
MPAHVVTIDADLCANDGACAAVCPAQLIRYDADLDVHVVIPEAAERCIACGHCLAVCPEGAVALDGVAAADCATVEPREWPGVADLGALICARRSVRQYQSRAVERNLLERLLETCRWAPTGSNRQEVAWSVVAERAGLERVGDTMVTWLKDNAVRPESIASRLPATWLIDGWERGDDPLFRGASTLVVNHGPEAGSAPYESALIAMSSFELLAASAGLGACWIGFLMGAAQECEALRVRLAVPDGHRLCGAMVVGYPSYAYQRVPPRQPLRLTWL